MSSAPNARIFISYSHRGRGEAWKAALLRALDVFERHQVLDVWQDGKIRVSSSWDDDIKQVIGSARLAVLLLTKEALDSEYILSTEFPLLRERQQRGELLVFPVICEECDWRAHDWLHATQAPNESNPLSQLSEAARDGIFRQVATNIAQELGRVVLAELPKAGQPLSPEDVYLDKFPLTRAAGLREEKLIGREQELALLDLVFTQPHTTIVSLVAWGGVGKTMLVQHWLQRLQRENWFGVRRVYAWNFYSQGTREDREASEDTFLGHALEWFGVQCEPTLSPWEKGRLLADAVSHERTLLILDGIEPLQYPPGPMGGQLRAPGVQSLLKHLARKSSALNSQSQTFSQSLCLVTTREPLTDLADFQRREGSPWGSVLGVDLNNLADEAGAALLHHAGANRAGAAEIKPDDKELLAASREVDGHALTLNLLGRFLARAHGGDISHRDLISFEEADRKQQGGTTFKMLAAFENWFANEGDIESRALSILRLLGLFDRPADAGCMSALRTPPLIDGLTEPLFTLKRNSKTGQLIEQPLSDKAWNNSTHFLFDFGLILIQAEPGGRESLLDCHPLIREYFASRIRGMEFSGRQRAHERLYVHLMAHTVKKARPTLLELQPLYQAIYHGCNGGLQFHACAEAYERRIRKKNAQYSRTVLAAYDSDLAALRCFFTRDWVCDWPLPDQRDSQGWLSGGGFSFPTESAARTQMRGDQFWLRGDASGCLGALGRVREARQLMQTVRDEAVKEQNWKEAGICCNNLSEMDLALGDVDQAVQDANQAATLIQKERTYVEGRSGSLNDFYVGLTKFQERELAAQTILGYCLLSSGRYKDAESIFSYLFNNHIFVVALNWMHHEFFLDRVERVVWSLILRGKTAFQNPLDSQAHELDETAAGYFHHCGVVMEWAEETLRHAEKHEWPLVAALAHDVKARVSFCQGAFFIGMGTIWLTNSLPEASAAVDGLNSTSDVKYIPSGHIHRARILSLMNDVTAAQTDLDEAWDIAQRGPLRLHIADIYLHRARLFFHEKKYPWQSPAADLAAAEKLIKECGYHRRDEELADAKRAILSR